MSSLLSAQSRVLHVRIVGAAIGATTSGVAAVLGLPMAILAIVGAVGIPVGAVIGFAVAPGIVAAENPRGLIIRSGVLATGAGWALYALLASLQQGNGASVLAFAGYTLAMALFSSAGAIIGFPMALLVGAVASWALRRSTPASRAWWVPSVLVVLLVAAGTTVVVARASAAAGEEAAGFGDRVALGYRVVNRSSRDYTLQIRGYWHGTVGEGSSSGLIGPGDCQGGTGDIQGSDWAIWMSPPDVEWADRPVGRPLITSLEYGPGRPVMLTITIAANGTPSIEPQFDGVPTNC